MPKGQKPAKREDRKSTLRKFAEGEYNYSRMGKTARKSKKIREAGKKNRFTDTKYNYRNMGKTVAEEKAKKKKKRKRRVIKSGLNADPPYGPKRKANEHLRQMRRESKRKKT